MRSLTLDRWTAETIDFMQRNGNALSNKYVAIMWPGAKLTIKCLVPRYYAARLGDFADVQVPTPATSKEDRIAFVRSKYATTQLKKKREGKWRKRIV